MASLEQLNCPPNEKKSAGIPVILSSNSHRPSSRYSKSSPHRHLPPAATIRDASTRSRGFSRLIANIYIYRGFKNGERPSTMRAIRGEGGKNIELKREGRHLLCFENTHCSIFARFLCSRKMKRNFFSPLPLFFYRKMDTFNEDT